jgi:hypothetical protein
LSLTFTSSLTLLIIIGFFSTKKHLYKIEQLFVFFLLVFSYLSFESIIHVNLKIWEISPGIGDYISFRMNGMIYVPLTLLWMIDLWQGTKTNFYQYGLILICFLLLLYLGDFILRYYEVYQSHNWHNGILGFVWILIFVVILMAQHLFRLLLKKEGFI